MLKHNVKKMETLWDDYVEAPCQENGNTRVRIMLKHHVKKLETLG